VAASGDGFETFIEEWNGSAWSVVPGAPASASASSLNGVSGSGPSDIWAVGQNSSTSFIEHWNGQSWSDVASPASEPPDGQLNAVSADSPTDAWAGGSSTMIVNDPTPLIEHWNGTQWTVSPGAINNGGRILSIAAISPADVWALAAVGKGNPAVIEHWNGSTWSIISLPVSGVLHGLSAVSANDVWAVGNGGLILNWNGTQWSQVANPAGKGAGLAAVAALSANDAWAINLKRRGDRAMERYPVDGRTPGQRAACRLQDRRRFHLERRQPVRPGERPAVRRRQHGQPDYDPAAAPAVTRGVSPGRPGLTPLWISDRDAYQLRMVKRRGKQVGDAGSHRLARRGGAPSGHRPSRPRPAREDVKAVAAKFGPLGP